MRRGQGGEWRFSRAVGGAELISARTQDDLRFLRIRTKRHELIITPGEPLFSPHTARDTTDRALQLTDEQYILASPRPT